MIREQITPPSDLDGAAYQSWLRRRIVNLENIQAQRIAVAAEQKRLIDVKVQRAQLEITNLKNQQTIGGVK